MASSKTDSIHPEQSEKYINHPAYLKTLEYVNSILMEYVNSTKEEDSNKEWDQLDKETKKKWRQLLQYLFESKNSNEEDVNSMVDSRIQEEVHEEQYYSERYELYADYRVYFIDNYSFLEKKLRKLYIKMGSSPGAAFLQWLLKNGVFKVVKKHFYDKFAHDCYVFIDNLSDEDENDDSSDERDLYFPASPDPSDTNGGFIQSPAEQSEKDDALPVNYVADRKERRKNPAHFAKRIIIKEAMIRIARLMSETDWQKFDYYIYAGLELYPHLDAKIFDSDADNDELLKTDSPNAELSDQCEKRELDPKEIELCGQLKKHIEDYVLKCQQGMAAISPERFLMEKHRFAQKSFIEQRDYLIDQINNHTNHGSKKRYIYNRQLIKNIAYSLLVPLDSAMIAEICNNALENPVQGLSRYRKTFFKDIFNIVNNYNEDADI